MSAYGVAMVALPYGYVTGLRKDARPAEASAVGGKPYAIGIDGRYVMSGAIQDRH